jgi:hypothetical protein
LDASSYNLRSFNGNRLGKSSGVAALAREWRVRSPVVYSKYGYYCPSPARVKLAINMSG